MIASKPMLHQASMAGKMRRGIVATAPTDAIEILPGFVDRVGRSGEGDVSTQQAVEVLALPYGLVRPRLAWDRVVRDSLSGRLVLPIPEDAVGESHDCQLDKETNDHESSAEYPGAQRRDGERWYEPADERRQ